MNAKVERLPKELIEKLKLAGWVLKQPATEAALGELISVTGALPDGVLQYLHTSDGLEHASLELVFNAHTMRIPSPSNSLLPLRDDGCGNYDAVILDDGPGHGAVVFWNHESCRAEYLIASSVPAYLRYLATPPEWKVSRREAVPCSDDVEGIRLGDDPAFRALLRREFTTETQKVVPGEPLPRGAKEAINPFTNKPFVIMPVLPRRPPPTRRPS